MALTFSKLFPVPRVFKECLSPTFLIHVLLFYALSHFSFFCAPFLFTFLAHILFCIFCFLLQQFLAFVCLAVRCFVARFICINMMLIFMISIMFHYAAFYDTSGSVCPLFGGFSGSI